MDVPFRSVSIVADLAFGGAVYATVNTSQFGLQVEAKNAKEFIALGREIKNALGTRACYGTYDCYGVILSHEDDSSADAVRQTNVTVNWSSPMGRSIALPVALELVQGRRCW